MNDMLFKPYSLDALSQTLGRWLLIRKSSSARRRPGTPGTSCQAAG